MTGGMMFKGTPGPWERDGLYVDAADGSSIFTALGYSASNTPLTNELSAANANLIAAAPELLDDGQFLLDRLAEFESELEDDVVAREFYGHVSPAIARFRAAIAKALGDQK